MSKIIRCSYYGKPVEEVGLIKCNQCGLEKPESEFLRRGNKLRRPCRQCHKEKCRSYHSKNRESILLKQKEYCRTEKYKISHRKSNEKYRKSEHWKLTSNINRNKKYQSRKHKISAMLKIHYLVRKNKISKPNICSICGNEFEKKLIHGHHKDHYKPYDVLWVCRWCHSKIHSGEIKCA